MTKIDMSKYIHATQKAAREGMPPHAILKVLLDQFRLLWPNLIPRVHIEICLVKAFNIPLMIAREIEPWKGFSQEGTITDQAIDELLSPWIARYLERDTSESA